MQHGDTKQNKDTVWNFGSRLAMDNISPTFNNYKEEVLGNRYATISKRSWNDTLKKCQAIYKNEIKCVVKQQFYHYLRDHNICLKELVAMKLYCDYDDLQREFRKMYRAPYNTDTERLRSFYHWHSTLSQTFHKLNEIAQRLPIANRATLHRVLYHGVSSVMNIAEFDGKCCGPLSTTPDLMVARSFAGREGMILVLEPRYERTNKLLDLTALSDFPDEQEIFTFDQFYSIKNVILSSVFDEFYKDYAQKYGSNMQVSKPIDDDIIDALIQPTALIVTLKMLYEALTSNNPIIHDKTLIDGLIVFILSCSKSDKLKFEETQTFVDSNIQYICNEHCSCATITFDDNLFTQYVKQKALVVPHIKTLVCEYFMSMKIRTSFA
eukprot:CAMPEP_0202696452 /NCGR_PEP_ID=MMETSP1385-20130828/9752_1 /ASSEMBLY_ACC=CAM_ASM_000861 /TAXON_ID=933848 /ORGANISM="Elphidium margaritaceum" /LENGTH=379 /DNA_ID=CAMNT_0049352629 /DNA_START=67 /DNA_END=1206 /DNA_ORIENTATION=-